MSQTLGLTALGIANSLGVGKRKVAEALFQGSRAGLRPRTGLVPGRTVYAGAIEADLPDLPSELAPFASRNNRLAQLVLNEIEEEIDAAIAVFGRDRIAVVMGTSTSGIADGETAFAFHAARGVWPQGYDYRLQETGSLAEFVARSLALTGPAYTIAAACSSSGKALAAAARLIRAGFADAALVGGVDTLCKMTVQGFAALEALSHGLCNPFSRNRDGINIGEAAAIFLLAPQPAAVLLAGTGETSDAHHVSAPDPTGKGAASAMAAALRQAGLTPAGIAYLNLHGTATPLNDAMEGRAVHAIFGDATPCSSTKAMTGHTLGAAGACEAAFLWLTLNTRYNPENWLPPHIWDGEADPDIPTPNLVAPCTKLAPPGRRVAAMSTSFAFGGSNVAIALERAAS
jgi:3-oxoacyl-[acyl-carrier-protein] synthase I